MALVASVGPSHAVDTVAVGTGSSAARTIATARVLGCAIAGGCELLLFYPVDTCAKRCMNNQEAISVGNCCRILFEEEAHLGPLARFQSLFPGLGFGMAYKVIQRVYQFGGQQYLKEHVMQRYQPRTSRSKTLCDGLAGSLTGVGEVALLPLDALKVKAQTNPEYRGQGAISILRRDGLRKLYAGWQWTMARNVPGSFALFGANALVKEYAFGLEDHREASFLQTVCSSIAGSVASILVACPMDVVKTRLQSGTFRGQAGLGIAAGVLRDEGAGAFFKGATPKVLTVGPKLVFSFTAAQCLMARFGDVKGGATH